MFTASALLFRCRSFYLYRLAVRVETFAQFVPEGIALLTLVRLSQITVSTNRMSLRVVAASHLCGG